MNWDQYKRTHPDWIKNNPGVRRCQGLFTRTRNDDTKRYACQLRWDHTGDCISFTAHKRWEKGNKIVVWNQLTLDLEPTSIEQAVLEVVSKALSQED